MPTTTAPRKTRRTAQGKRTHQAIVKAALAIASIEGLEGLTIGRLATELNMSKSGLFAHFGSKEGLQLATVEAAREIFMAEVVDPIRDMEPGLARLWRLGDGWLSYSKRDVFPGGCFFAAASIEFDGRPGQVRDAIATNLKDWTNALIRAAGKARDLGDLAADAEPEQIAFEVHALGLGANWAKQLYKDRNACGRAREAIIRSLRSFATKNAPPIPCVDPVSIPGRLYPS